MLPGVLQPSVLGELGSSGTAPSPDLFAFGEVQYLISSFSCCGRTHKQFEILYPPCMFCQICTARSSAHFPLSCSQRSHRGYKKPIQWAISGCVCLDYLSLQTVASLTWSDKSRRLTIPLTAWFCFSVQSVQFITFIGSASLGIQVFLTQPSSLCTSFLLMSVKQTYSIVGTL